MKAAIRSLFVLVLVLGTAIIGLYVRREAAPVPASPAVSELGDRHRADTGVPSPERSASDPRIEEIISRLDRLSEDVARLKAGSERTPADLPAEAPAPRESEELFIQSHRSAILRVIEEDKRRLALEQRIRLERMAAQGYLKSNQLSASEMTAINEILERWQRRAAEIREPYTGDQQSAWVAAWDELRTQRRAELTAQLGPFLAETLIEHLRRLGREPAGFHR